MARFFKRSPWIIHYDGSSCNGCDIETIACLTPVYDVERLGVLNTGNPKHADILLVTGSVNEQNKEAVRNIFDQMPDPKVVVAIGACAASGGVFAECYNVRGGLDGLIPVDVYVPGCAARPELIIDGVLESLEVLEEKRKTLKDMERGLVRITIGKASVEDAAEILALQKLAFRIEAEIYGDFGIAPLTESLEEITEEFRAKAFLKAVMGPKIVGSVRALLEGKACHINRLVVNPLYQHHGIGKRLMDEIEGLFPQAERFEVRVGHKSKRNIYFYHNIGYRDFRREKVSDSLERVYMQKFAAKEAR